MSKFDEITSPQTTIRMGAAHYDVTSIDGIGRVVRIDLSKVPEKVRRDTLHSYSRSICKLHGIK